MIEGVAISEPTNVGSLAADDTTSGVVSNPGILGGMPVIVGTRVPADTLVAYLRDGYSATDVLEDYPTLPANWLRAVEEWAVAQHGADWRTAAPVKP